MIRVACERGIGYAKITYGALIVFGLMGLGAIVFIALPTLSKALSSGICQTNARKVNDAIRRASSEGVSNVVFVADLVPKYLREEPYCPCGHGSSYVLDPRYGAVCPVFAEYPDHNLPLMCKTAERVFSMITGTCAAADMALTNASAISADDLFSTDPE